MSEPVAPEIFVELNFLSASEGGRVSPISCGEYRGVLGVEGGHFSVRFCVTSEQETAPGKSGKFGVQFLAPEVALPLFKVGVEFSVWEGKTIGHGRVLEVVRHA